MSSESNHPGRPGRPGTETTATQETRPNPIDAATSERSRHSETDDGHPGSGTRTRIVSLKAKVELLEAEREALINQVLALEADVAELEEEVDTLEATVESEEQQRQQVIDKYEHIIAEKAEVNRELREEFEATDKTGIRRVCRLPAITSSIETVRARLKHLIPNE